MNSLHVSCHMHVATPMFRHLCFLLLASIGLTMPLRAQSTWTGIGSNDYWTTSQNWSGGIPTASANVVFNDADETIYGIAGSLFDLPNAIASLTFANSGIGTTGLYPRILSPNDWQYVSIDSGKTLSISSSASASILRVGVAGQTGNNLTQARIGGEGALALNDASGYLWVANAYSLSGTTTSGATITPAYRAILDLSTLSSFNATLNQFLVGTAYVGSAAGTSSPNGLANPTGLVKLAKNNSITATTIAVGSSNSGASNGNALLLGRANTLAADNILVGGYISGTYNYQGGTLAFNPDLAPDSTNVATIRGSNGTAAVANFVVGQHNNAVNNSLISMADFTSGRVDALIANLTIADSRSTNTSRMQGFYLMDEGKTEVATAIVGRTGASSTSTGTSVGGLYVAGGNFKATDMTLASNTSGAALIAGNFLISGNASAEITGTNGLVMGVRSGTAATVSPTVTISSGSLKISGGNIAEGTGAGANIFSTLNLNGGTLDMAGHSITVDAFSATGGTLKNVSGITTSSGSGLIKSGGTSVLTLDGTNSFSGGITVNGGALLLQAASALPSSGILTVNSGGAFALNTAGFQALLAVLKADSRLASSSTGSFALTTANASENVDFSSAGLDLAGAYLGALGRISYTGIFTPNGGVYRLGGGSGELAFHVDITAGSVEIGGGPGSVILAGANTFSGGTTLKAGALVLTALDDLGGVSQNGALTFNGGILQWASGFAGDVSANNRAVTFSSGGGTLDTNGNDVSLTSSLGGTGALTKTGAGTLALSGTNLGSTALVVNKGTLSLGVAALGVTPALSLGGGSLNAASSQTLGNLSLSGNAASSVTAPSGSILTLGNTWSRSVGSSLYVDVSGGGTVSSQPIASISSQGQTSTLLPYVVVRDSAGTGLGVVVNNNIVRYTGYYGVSTSFRQFQNTYNYKFTTSSTALNVTNSGNANPASLAFDNLVAGTVTFQSSDLYRLNGSANGTGGFLMTGLAYYEMTGGNFGITNSTELLLNQYGVGAFNIASNINSNNGPSSALTKTGSGELILSNSANTFTGSVVVTGGVLSATSLNLGGLTSSLGASTNAAGNLVLNGGALQYTGAAATTTDRNFTVGGNGGAILSNGIGVVNWLGSMTASATAGSQSFILGGSNVGSNTLSGLISDGAGSVTSFGKTGAGTWVLTGASDYGGTTSIIGGDLILAGSLTRTSDVAVQSGARLMLNYDSATIGSDSSKINNDASLTLAGGAVILVGGSHAEAVQSTTLASGASSISRTSGAATLGLNAITAHNGGTLNLAGDSIATTDTGNTHGILGGWATVGGTDWAASVDGGAADTAIVRFTGYSSLGTSGVSTDNALLRGSAALAGDVTTNSLKIAGDGSALTLDLAGHTLTLSSGGLLFSGGSDFTIAGGTLKSASSSNSDLIVQHYGAGALVIDSGIVDGTGSSTLTKSGTGRLVLSGANSYGGKTYVNSGILNVRSATALGATSAGTTVAFGATLEMEGGITIGAEVLSLAGTGVEGNGALRNISGTNVYGGAITLSDAAGIQSDAGSLTLGNTITGNGNSLSFNGSGAILVTGPVSSVSKINKNGSGSLSLGDIAISRDSLFFDGLGNSTVSGVISGTGALIKNGSGTLTLSGVNTYTGATAVYAGGLTLDYAVNAGSRLADGAALALSGATVTLTGGAYTEAVSSTVIGAGASTITRSSGSSVLSLGSGITNATFGGTLNIAAANIATTTAGVSNNILGGYITVGGANWAAKSGNNIVALSSYDTLANATSTRNVALTGSGSISAATSAYTVKVNSNGSGQSLNLAGNAMTIASGGLLYVGSDDYTIGTGTGSNLGSLNTGNTNNSLYIHQYGTGTLTIGATISNGAGNLTTGGALVKTGSGKLVLTGNNTYSGNTYINDGILSISSESNILAPATSFLTGVSYTYSSGNYTLTSTMTDLPSDLIVGTSQVNVSNGIAYTATVTGISGSSGNWSISLSQYLLSSGSVSSGLLAYANTPGSLYIDGGTLQATGTFSLSRNVYLGANGSGVDVTGANVLNLAGPLADNPSGGNGSLIKTGSGTLALSGTNTYTGATTVSEGTLLAGVANSAFGNKSAVSLASGATLALDGFDQTLGSLANVGASGGSVSLAGATLTTGADNSSTQFSGVISGSGGLVKNGSGTFVLNGANTYTGATKVNSGTLLISDGVTSGSLTSSQVTVAAGATLGGSGSVTGTIQVLSGGRLAPGNSPGILSAGALNLASGSTLVMELAGATAGTGYDQIVAGEIALSGDLQLSLSFIPFGYSFTLIENTGLDAVQGSFATINGQAFGPGGTFSLTYDSVSYDFTISYTGGTGNDVVIEAVPEPATWILVAVAGVVGFCIRRKLACPAA